jgi:hypothetical protein
LLRHETEKPQKEHMMKNRLITTLSFLLTAFSANAYSHTGAHAGDWFQIMIHFITNVVHLPLIALVMVIVILGVKRFLTHDPQQ